MGEEGSSRSCRLCAFARTGIYTSGPLPPCKSASVRCVRGYWDRAYSLRHFRKICAERRFAHEATSCPDFQMADPLRELALLLMLECEP